MKISKSKARKMMNKRRLKSRRKGTIVATTASGAIEYVLDKGIDAPRKIKKG